MIIELATMTYDEYLLYTHLEKQNTIRCINIDEDYYEVLDEKQFFLIVMKHGLEYTVIENLKDYY
jgi:hypothetical protein